LLWICKWVESPGHRRGPEERQTLHWAPRTARPGSVSPRTPSRWSVAMVTAGVRPRRVRAKVAGSLVLVRALWREDDFGPLHRRIFVVAALPVRR
jgi:hypothetical protein